MICSPFPVPCLSLVKFSVSYDKSFTMQLSLYLSSFLPSVVFIFGKKIVPNSLFFLGALLTWTTGQYRHHGMSSWYP